MKYAPYPRYKPSGIEWLGNVPEEWNVTPLKFLAMIGNGSTPARDNAEYWSEGTYPWLNSSVVNQHAVVAASDFVTDEALAECHLPRVSPPAVLVGITGEGRTRGMATMLLIEATVSQHLAYLKPLTSRVDVRYLRRVLDHAYEYLRSESEGGGSTKGAITCEQLGSLQLPAPAVSEQRRIADFLDARVVKLDTLVAKKRALIERLQEKRAALISRAVTRGLPPEAARAAGLDPHPRLQQSGIEWLGDVPEHWEVVRLKRMLTRVDQGWSPNASTWPAADGEWGVLKLSAARLGEFIPSENKALESEAIGPTAVTPEAGDLLVSRANTPERVGDVCFVTRGEPTLLIPDLLYRLKLQTRRAAPAFVKYFLLSKAGRSQIEADARGSSGSMVKLSQDHLRSWRITQPPLDEQRAIAAFLDRETGSIDRLVAKVETAIERLHEYQAALITAAVTGKIDVRPAV